MAKVPIFTFINSDSQERKKTTLDSLQNDSSVIPSDWYALFRLQLANYLGKEMKVVQNDEWEISAQNTAIEVRQHNNHFLIWADDLAELPLEVLLRICRYHVA